MKKCFADCICPDFEAVTALCGAVRRVVIARRSQRSARAMFFGGDSDKSRPAGLRRCRRLEGCVFLRSAGCGWRSLFSDVRCNGAGQCAMLHIAGSSVVFSCRAVVSCCEAVRSGLWGLNIAQGAVLASIVPFPSVLPDRDSRDVRSMGSRLLGTFVGGRGFVRQKGAEALHLIATGCAVCEAYGGASCRNRLRAIFVRR